MLVDYHKQYAPERFKHPDGTPLGRRSLQVIAKRYRLPVIRVGHSTLIDEEAGDDRLREIAEHREPAPQPARRGRPRAGA